MPPATAPLEPAPSRRPAPSTRRTLADRALAVLDGVVVALTLLAVLYVLAGGYSLGVLSVRRFSKPFLLLVVLGSLRAAIPRGSWLTRALRGGRDRLARG